MPETAPRVATSSRTVSVKFLGFLRRVAGHREVGVAVSVDATVGDLLQALAGRYGDAFTEAVFRAPGEVHTHLRVFLNGDEARLTDRLTGDGSSAEVALLIVPGFEGGS
jgi:molybdopterin converting factor small subunit